MVRRLGVGRWQATETNNGAAICVCRTLHIDVVMA
jgi:hypothetical protein